MTDNEIDLLLLIHLDSEHPTLQMAPVRHVRERLSLLIRDGRIAIRAPLVEVVVTGTIPQGGYMRTLSGGVRMAALESLRVGWKIEPLL